MTCEQAREQAVAFSTGAQAAEDCAALFEHLDGCPDCQTYFERIMAAVERLPYAARPVAPPPRLRALVLAAVAGEAADSARRAAPGRGRMPRDSKRRWVMGLGAAAAALLLALNAWLTGALLSLRADYHNLASSYAGLQADYQALAAGHAALETRYELLEKARSQTLTQLWGVSVALVQESPERVWEADLTGTDAAPEARGRVVVYRRSAGYLVVLVADGLPPLERDQVYQCWLLRDGERTSAGVFTVDARGRGSLAYYVEEFSFQGIGITHEPDPWGEAPRGQRMLAGTF